MKLRPFLYPRFAYCFPLRDLIPSIIHLCGRRRPESSEGLSFFNGIKSYDYNYGRTALRVALSCLRPGKELRIGVQAYNCETVFQSIHRAGHIPVFIDIGEDYLMDPVDLKAKSDQIDALVLTQTFGAQPAIEDFREIMGERPIIEDCAHSMFSPLGMRKRETSADFSIYSCGFGKFPAIGNGGFLICHNASFRASLEAEDKKLSRPGHREELSVLLKTAILALAHLRPLYGSISYSFGKKIDRGVDFLGKENVKETKGYSYVLRLLHRNEERYIRLRSGKVEKASFLNQLLNPPKPGQWEKQLFFPFQSDRAEELKRVLLDANNESSGHFSRSIEWAGNYGYHQGSCPRTEFLLPGIFTLSIHSYTSRSHLQKLAGILNSA